MDVEVWLPSLAQILVAVGTIILALMVYKQIRESRKTLAREIHANDLKAFIRNWRGEIVPAYVDPSMMTTRDPKSSSSGVERGPLFEDLKVHLHRGSRLMDSYLEYERYWTYYKETGFDLYSKIRADSCAKTNEKLAPGNENGLQQGFVKTLHQQYLAYAHKSKVHYDVQDGYTKVGNPPRIQISWEGSTLAYMEDTAKANRIIDAHRQMLKDFTNARYLSPAKRLVDLAGEIEQKTLTVLREMDEILAQPLFPVDCKFIRRSLGGWFRRAGGK